MKRLIYLLVGSVIVATSCGKERMAEINTDPSNVDKPQLQYLFSDALLSLQSQSYGEWFYDNAQYILPWMQVTVGNSGSSNGANFNQMGAQGDRFAVFYNQLGGPVSRIRNIIDTKLSDYDKTSYQDLKALTYIVHIYYGIRVTDITGSIPYSEALQGFYTNPPMLTPKYDTQTKLLTDWDSQLQQAINVLSTTKTLNGQVIPQVKLTSQQDFIYKGNNDLWIKLANTLRLKIAVRLLNENKDRALTIASSVAEDGRIMNSLNDEFYWYGGEQFYNFSDAIWHGVGAKNFITFLRENHDPRLRFVFSKNDFNSMVMQGFLNQNVTIPSYILDNAIIDNSDGTPEFKGWKGDGEPWVRYQGAPVTVQGEIPSAIENEYFTTTKFQLNIGSTVRTFYPTSFFNRNMVQPNEWFTFPDTLVISQQYKPDGNFPYRVSLVSAAETQFYLAELKLMGATIAEDAATLFRNGVQLSVESLNRNAADLNIPEYKEPYDKKYGKAVALLPDEIPALLENSNYMLTGNSDTDLEKIHINLIIDRLLTPTEIYVTARRSGVPFKNSTIWNRENFSANAFPIPRRFVATEPSKANINYKNTMDAYLEEGFTVNTNEPAILNSQRIWYDKKAPEFGGN